MIRKMLYFLLALVLPVVACQREAIINTTVELGFSAGTEVPVKTSFGPSEEGKRLMYWTTSDVVGLKVDYGESLWQARVNPAPDCRTAIFSAALTIPESGSFTIQAVTPRSAFLSADATAKTLKLNIPATQSPKKDDSDAKGQVLVANTTLTSAPAEAVNLTFSHVTAYAQLSLTNVPTSSAVSAIEITSSVPLVGEWTYDPATKTCVASNASSTITLNTDKKTNILFGVAPVDMSGAVLTVNMTTGAGLVSKEFTLTGSHAFRSGVISKITLDMTGASVPEKKGISVLAIGNSFSVDAMQYLYGILKAAGQDDIVLGNLYIGGCTLQTHASHFASNNGAYTYYKNTTGSWTSTGSYKPLSALTERDWDYITLQQASGSSGIASTYDPYLGQVLAVVKEKCPGAKLLWHMTWAYQQNSTHSEFPKYDSDQMTMYNAIVSAVQSQVLTNTSFTGVIPCGTAVQNLRTSKLGDNTTRDGYHMSYDIGRYVTGLMWARVLTGATIEGNTYRPSGYAYSTETVGILTESVENAFLKPYEVTKSTYEPEPYTPPAGLSDILKNAGYNPDSYEALALTITKKAYYNSTSNSTMQCAASGSTASNLVQFAATQIIPKAQIPNGSVIVLKDGFQYRPEGWTSLSTKNASSARPGNVTTQVVEVNDTWWASWNYRAFNLAKKGNPNLTDAEQEELLSCFAIFVPKN